MTVRLPPTTVIYENIQSVLGGLTVVGLGWLLGYTFAPPPWGVRIAVGLTVAVACGLALDAFLNRRQQKYFWAAVTSQGCQFHRGRFMTTETVIVPGSILSIDVARGPLLRKLGLARLKFNGIAQFPEIPPMAEADAVAIQTLLTMGHEESNARHTEETSAPCNE